MNIKRQKKNVQTPKASKESVRLISHMLNENYEAAEDVLREMVKKNIQRKIEKARKEIKIF